ncbi:hypothetical protein PR202_gb19944 [Eleusine coracana subsp. coracana]|uniref:Uncharacterized protein n=1 Tax=Eleusine coracana subsp. coracana TaxID=191504 RepID=A0AAV5F9H8_ELECO|nr:hypothetical protein PR202_gb19944 [Eleusine coracana subsp. coracana]
MRTRMEEKFAHAFVWRLPDGMEAEELSMEEKFALSMLRFVPLEAGKKYVVVDDDACSSATSPEEFVWMIDEISSVTACST